MIVWRLRFCRCFSFGVNNAGFNFQLVAIAFWAVLWPRLIGEIIVEDKTPLHLGYR